MEDDHASSQATAMEDDPAGSLPSCAPQQAMHEQEPETLQQRSLHDCTLRSLAMADDDLATLRRSLEACSRGSAAMADQLRHGQFLDLHPGRFTSFLWHLPDNRLLPSTAVSVAVLDSPPDHHPSSPFAAILAPRDRELDWIFCTENGQWDLLFSASVSRLVVLNRLSEAASQNTENEGIQHAETSSRKTGTDDRLQSDPSISAADADNPLEDEDEVFKKEVDLLLVSLFPWRRFPDRFPTEPFVSYEDRVAIRLVVENASSPLSGNILVEDVELLPNTDDQEHDSTDNHKIKLRRRMRFQQMPNLIQTEIPITVCNNGQPVLLGLQAFKDGKDLEVRPDHNELVHTYLPPIVAGLVLASSRLDASVVAGNKARVLSIGIGGGALPMFLYSKLGFHVLAIDLDEVVLRLARCHFGLKEDEHLQIQVNDGVDAVVSIAEQAIRSKLVAVQLLKEWEELHQHVQGPRCKSLRGSEQPEGVDVRMDVIIVDVDAGDPRLGSTSPPPAFLQKTFLLAARIALQDGGMLAMNIIAREPKYYKLAVKALQQVFAGLYEIQVEDNHVVFALPTKIQDINLNCTFALQIMQAIDKDWIYHIVEVI